jgi:thiol-disulfide isomerase/thioredoxin
MSSQLLAGKVGLVNFWATWCAPCMRELPALAEFYEEVSGQGFEILAVNVDRQENKARAYLSREPVPFPVLLDPKSSVMGQFDVLAMPTSVLVDREGRILEHHTGFDEEWFEELKKKVRLHL